MMTKSTTFLAACLFGSLAVAMPQKRADATPTVSLWLPQLADSDPSVTFAASVVTVKPTITSYALCPIGVPKSLCDKVAVTVGQGPSTYELFNTIDVEEIQGKNEVRCKLAGTTSASCVASVSARVKGIATTTVTTTVFTDAELMTFVPVRVTAGADKLPATTSANPTADITGTASGAAATETGDNAAATTASTGGVPRVTGSPGWLVSGAAVAMAAIAAL